MTTTSPQSPAPAARQLLSLASLWLVLRAPETFALSLVALGAVMALAAAIPQRPASFATPGNFVVWASNLPPFFQQVYQPLDTLGLFGIYHSAWFWLPAAWLTLSSLILLADFLPATLDRLSRDPARLSDPRPHPLSRRHRKVLRLPAPTSAAEATSADAPLQALQVRLQANGFALLPAAEGKPVIAVRHPRRWSSPLALVLGVLLVVLGVVIQSLWGGVGEITLSAHGDTPLSFVGRSVQLQSITSHADRGGNLSGASVTLAVDGQTVDGQLHRPFRLDGWWLVPARLQPLARITIAGEQTSDEIDLIFGDTTRPLRFAFAPQGVTFELRYVPAPDTPTYRLNIVSPALSAQPVVQQNQLFFVPDLGLRGQVVLRDRLLLRAYKLPGFVPLAAGSVLFLLGMAGLWLPLPAIVRLQVVTRGRGSRIAAEVETLGDDALAGEIAGAVLLLRLPDDDG